MIEEDQDQILWRLLEFMAATFLDLKKLHVKQLAQAYAWAPVSVFLTFKYVYLLLL